MGEVREQIDRIDRALVKLIAERLAYIERATSSRSRAMPFAMSGAFKTF
jgi:chorismate mutase